jgi:excisionase family DNA binding protein
MTTQHNTSTPDPLLTPTQVCDWLGVTPRWLRRALERRQLEVVKLGRLNRFPESTIRQLIADNTRSARD